MEKPIIINDWYRGVGASAFTGFQEIRGLNILDKPGIVYPNYALTKESSTTVDGLILDLQIDPLTGIVYGYSSTKVFSRATNGTWAVITGHGATSSAFVGMFVWRSYSSSGSYIFFIHASGAIDVYDSSTGQGWTNNWKNAWVTLGGSTFHKPARVSKSDDKVYIGNGTGNYGLVSIDENAGQTFDPDTAGTYTVTNPVLAIPTNHKIKSLIDFGNDILIGTYITNDDSKATIFPFDVTATIAAYNLPVEIGEDTVHKMIEKNNVVYVNAGRTGRIYATNGTSVEEFVRLPETMIGGALASANADNLFTGSANGMVVNGNEILLGWHGAFTGSNVNFGIYSIDIRSRAISLKNLISTGMDGLTSEVYIGAILPLNPKKYLVSWYDAASATYGVDVTGSTGYASDLAYLITRFMPVGTDAISRSFERPEIRLAKPMVTGDSLKVWVRTSQSGVWTEFGDPYYTESTVGFQNGIMPAISAVENIQLKVALNGTVELMEIRLI